MKAHVENSPLTQRTKIWIYQHDPLGQTTHYLASDLDTMTPYIAGAPGPEPTLVLNYRVAEALASALATMGRPEEATQRHLGDAIAVRDRLLALVEKAA